MENNNKDTAPSFSQKEIHLSRQDVDETQDIHDSAADEAKLQPETFTIDLPDVSDIPGQENIHVPRMGEMADTTISSSDEEGDGLFGDDEESDIGDDDSEETDSNVSKQEKTLLQQAEDDMPTEDDSNLRKSTLDDTDNEGEPLNEGSDVSGDDLDTGGVEDDDDMEDIGEEDEENNPYSLGGDDNDDVTEGTP